MVRTAILSWSALGVALGLFAYASSGCDSEQETTDTSGQCPTSPPFGPTACGLEGQQCSWGDGPECVPPCNGACGGTVCTCLGGQWGCQAWDDWGEPCGGGGGEAGQGGSGAGGGGSSGGAPVDCTAVDCRYVREGASGAATGADWAEAYPALPDELERAVVYLVADGSYPAYTFDDPNVGEQAVTIRKALVGDHGTSVGWLDDYGDGQAVFAGVTLVSDYLVFDGARRNEDDWTDGASYGFRCVGGFYSNTANFGSCASHVTIRYVDVGGTLSESYDPSMPESAFYFGGFDELCSHWTISHVFAHNVGIVGQMAGVDDIVWQNSWLGLNWSKEILRSQIQGSNITVRHSILKDGCRDDHAPGTGCTAEIAFFGNAGSTDESYDNARFYGNVIWKTIGQHNSDACIMVQNAHGAVAYNNTLVNDGSTGQCIISLAGSGSSARNNVWYVPNGIAGGCQATVCDFNTIYTSSAPPFVSVIDGDFHLTEPLAGVSLASPFDTDIDGVTRGADGVWDQGAFERSP